MGHIIFSDRNFHISDRKYKVFRGEVKALSYLFDSANQNRQYIVAIGDDSKGKNDIASDSAQSGSALILIKVSYLVDT
jgi:hypothetical protein